MDTIDIIIPTLGGNKLFSTISSINKGILKPKKIICVYYGNINKIKYKKFKNLQFVKSKEKGQVVQRNLGFKYSKSKFILQLDDDIVLNKNCLSKLIKAKKKLPDNAFLAPIILDNEGNSFYTNENKSNILLNFYKYFICAAPFGEKKIGKFTSLTLCYGVNKQIKNSFFKCTWLPGGCILFSRKYLKYKTDKFPFKGKAYCEDLFYSIKRSNLNLKHYVIKGALVKTFKNSDKFIFKNFIDEITIRYYLLKILKGSKIRFFIWVIFEFFIRNFIK